MVEVFIYDSLRTPFGKGNKSGALFEVRPIDLLSKCLTALKSRNPLITTAIEDFIIGCVVPTGGQADNIAKTALLHAGWDASIPGIQVNRFQVSGLASVGLGAAKIKAGWADLIIAGGIESMSRIHRQDNRGAISSDPDIINRIGSIPIGIAADLLATIEKLSKEQLDKFAFQSIQKAQTAAKKGYYSKSIIPIYDQNKIAILKEDETIRRQLSVEEIEQSSTIFPQSNRIGFDAIALRKYPLIEQITGTHSNANKASPADSAAVILLGSSNQQKKLGLQPRAKIVATHTTSSDLTITHRGGIKATKEILKRAKLKISDIDLWYVNESFAAPALLFQKTFKIANKSFNSAGGNIAFGESLGANGTVLLGMLLDELERQKLKRGLIAISAEGGIGMSMIIEIV